MAGGTEIDPIVFPPKLQRAGFTGTRDKITSFQRQNLMKMLTLARPRILRHGDCLGADTECHMMCITFRIPMVIYPPDVDTYRAFNGMLYGPGSSSPLYKIMDPKPYRQRNHDIVDNSDYLIACPKENKEVLRSGTWQTVRYTRSKGKMIIYLYPDGRVDNSEVVG